MYIVGLNLLSYTPKRFLSLKDNSFFFLSERHTFKYGKKLEKTDLICVLIFNVCLFICFAAIRNYSINNFKCKFVEPRIIIKCFLGISRLITAGIDIN